EKLTGAERNNKQFNDFDRTKALSNYFIPPETVLAPHVLKDGADSVGVLGALTVSTFILGFSAMNGWFHFSRWTENLPQRGSPPSRSPYCRKTPPTGTRTWRRPPTWRYFSSRAPDPIT